MRTRRAFTDDGIGLTGTVDRRNKDVVGARTPKSFSRTEVSIEAHHVSSQQAIEYGNGRDLAIEGAAMLGGVP
jgi:hypothetical protein